MSTIDTVGQIVTTVLSSGILFICAFIYNKTKQRWRRQDRQDELYRIKIDCIVLALENLEINGEEFKKCYHSLFEERIKNIKYIEDEN